MPVYDVKLPIRAEITVRIEAEDEEGAIERATDSGSRDLQTLENHVGHFFNFIDVDEDRKAEVSIARKDDD